jgi:hypothetical protein
VRDCIVVAAGDVWIKVSEAFVHLDHVQQQRAYICACSRPAGVCEQCHRPLADVLEGGDALLTAVRCEQCGQSYSYVDAPRACDAKPEALAPEVVTPRRT